MSQHETKFVTIEEHQLAFLEVNKQHKQTIFLLHGNSGSSEIWIPQLVHPLLKNYRIVALDLPGHGHSSPMLHSKDYNVITMGRLVAKAISLLAKNNPFIVAGLSLGTNIIGEMITYIKPAGVVLISSTIVGGSITPADLVTAGVSGTVLYEDKPEPHLVEAYARETIHTQSQVLNDLIIRDYHRVQPSFRSTLKESIPAKLYSDEVSNLISYQHPVLCIAGENDKVTNPALMKRAPLKYWNDQIYLLPDAGHVVSVDQPDALSQLLAAYSNAMFKEVHA